ncbi:MAG: hypothetical protein Q8L86_16715 [Vicinamibacterales bacterium]|nr:hypothetical protein [Vicinamibacterales bacterium]
MTPMTWEKHGLIFRPDPSRPWMRSHAAVPTPLQLDGSLYRVYFSSRDERNRSHVGFFEIDLASPERILAVSPEPVLAPGPTGCFDADGIYAESVVRVGDEVRLYTIGVTTGHTPPLFYAAIGLATSRDGGATFARHSAAPIMGRSAHDPCLVTAPFVLRDGDRWRMWYVSGTSWTEETHGWQSHYHVKYAESADGVTWLRDGHNCIAPQDPRENNIARLWVVPDGEGYRGWYSVNAGEGYRLGYAESRDGYDWRRLDHLTGIALSPDGWDAQAQAYPAVVRHGDRWFMFYNGNGFGRDGVGLAIAPA